MAIVVGMVAVLYRARKTGDRAFFLDLGIVIVTVLIVAGLLAEGRHQPAPPAWSATVRPTTPLLTLPPSPTGTPQPLTPTPIITPSPTPFTHTVKLGETLSSIAEMYGLVIEEVITYNQLLDPSYIKPGQEVAIPFRRPVTPTPTPAPRPTQVAVEQPTRPRPSPTFSPTVTPSPTSTPSLYPVPVLVRPEGGKWFKVGEAIELEWMWGRELGPDEHFDVQVWLLEEGQKPQGIAWSRETRYRLKRDKPGQYAWRIVVIRGGKDGKWIADLSPPSQERTFNVAQ